MYYVLFSIDAQDFAFELSSVDRVVNATDPLEVGAFLETVCGSTLIDGESVPVINMRRFLDLDERELEPGDQFIICAVKKKKYALWVDMVKGVEPFSDKSLALAKDIFPDMNLIEYVIKNDFKMILVFNPKHLSSLDLVKV